MVGLPDSGKLLMQKNMFARSSNISSMNYSSLQKKTLDQLHITCIVHVVISWSELSTLRRLFLSESALNWNSIEILKSTQFMLYFWVEHDIQMVFMREAINKGKFVQDTHYVVGFQSTARFIVSIPPSFLFLSWHLPSLSRGNKFSFSVAPQDVAAIASIAQCPRCACSRNCLKSKKFRSILNC